MTTINNHYHSILQFSCFKTAIRTSAHSLNLFLSLEKELVEFLSSVHLHLFSEDINDISKEYSGDIEYSQRILEILNILGI